LDLAEEEARLPADSSISRSDRDAHHNASMGTQAGLRRHAERKGTTAISALTAIIGLPSDLGIRSQRSLKPGLILLAAKVGINLAGPESFRVSHALLARR
jgi:hypothetical protein